MKNLKALLSFLILFSVALPVLLSTVISSFIIEGIAEEQIHQRFISEVGHVERHVTAIFDQVEARANFLANTNLVKNSLGQLPQYQQKTNISAESIELTSPLLQQIYQQFQNIGNSMPDIAYVYLGDRRGGYLQWPTGSLPDNYDPTKRPWYVSGLQGKGNIVRPPAYYWAQDDTVVISTVRSLTLENSWSGVLGVDVSLAQLNDILRNIDLQFDERFLLIEKGGRILADTGNKDSLFGNLSEFASESVIEKFRRMGHTEEAQITLDGELNWVSKFEFSELGWTFFVLVPFDALALQSRKVNAYSMYIALICVVIFCLIGYGIAAKITNLIRTREHQLVDAKSQAEQAVVAKSQFLANMSHEIRTPLNGVLGMTQLLAKTSMTHEQKQKVDTILLSGNRLMHLINEVLDLSKVEANELVLSPRSVQLARLLSNLVLSFKASAQEKHLDLILHAQDLEHIVAELDDAKLGQVISNLLSNAIKFTSKGYVSVKATITDNARMLRVEVSDSGIGLTAEQCDIIFDAFKQADSSTSRKYGGTGLGLALSAAIIEIMGGKLKVASEPDIGSTFYFSVPVDILENETQHEQTYETQWAGLKVLILDDIKPNLDVLSEILANVNAHVECFIEPFKALERICAGEHFDVVIVDYMMPGIDGIDWIQKANPGPKTRRILFTSVEDASTTQRAKSYFHKVIYKPALERDILSLINTETKSAPVEHSESPTLMQGKILVVEDNEINFMILDTLLKGMGLQVIWAEDGEKGVEYYEQDSFDVIFMDCMLPGIDGYQATQAIRASAKPGSTSIPIIALTADTTGDNEAKCLDAGMTDYLTKPFNVDKLQSVLCRYLKPAERDDA
ncbi:hybrid sensor histidine kinase/response regulator [Alteromonas sediminis]|uniref:histidine kinase n=1 Tax=Alteromonas sediminis TaxID=2259342 RepID=A0A3N5XXP0_9ALTE|nr:hybrid sensor histidine kinase/response regulator [Alteromonas sediminis]RPJ65223.1 hybrid sensor histidine kinase/response regulator [Alteromonas sediminis]